MQMLTEMLGLFLKVPKVHTAVRLLSSALLVYMSLLAMYKCSVGMLCVAEHSYQLGFRCRYNGICYIASLSDCPPDSILCLYVPVH